MRKAAAIVFGIILVFSMFVYSFAEENDIINIKELDLSVAVPDGFDVFTRDTAANDPLYSRYGITYDQMLSTMKAQNTFLDAISSDRITEITISALHTRNSDFDQLSDTDIFAMGSALQEQLSKNGLTVTNCDIYSHSQTKFLKILAYRSVSGRTIHALQYTTIFGGKTINITLQSYSGIEVTPTQETVMKEVVDSVEFKVSSAEKINPAVFSGNSSAAKSDSTQASAVQSKQKSISGFILFSLAVAATALYIGLHFYFKGRSIAKADAKATGSIMENTEDPPTYAQPIARENTGSYHALRSIALKENEAPKYCRKCGNPLLPDSIFCDHCGTKVQ